MELRFLLGKFFGDRKDNVDLLEEILFQCRYSLLKRPGINQKTERVIAEVK